MDSDRRFMNANLRSLLVAGLAAMLVFFTNLGVPTLWDKDEPRNAACAMEMLQRGDWIVPTFNNDLRTDKPILIYWLMLAAYHAFGVSEFAARFWSAALSVGTVLLTCRMGRLLYRSQAGTWAGLLLAAALMFGIAARAATPDATLIFCTTLALYLFVSASVVQNPGETVPLPDNGSGVARPLEEMRSGLPGDFQGPSRRGLIGMFTAIGFAVLAKGPAGLLLPLSVVLVFMTLMSRAASVPCSSDGTATAAESWNAWRARLLAAIALVRLPRMLLLTSAIVLPWYVAVGLRTDGAWLSGFLGKHNLMRYWSAMEGHSGPVFYYLPAILAGFFPGSVLLPAALWTSFQRVRGNCRNSWSDTFLLCWVGVYVVFFSLSNTKLPSYVLPCYPALALLVGQLIDLWVRRMTTFHPQVFRAAFGSACAVGALMCIACPIAVHYLLPGETALGLVGFVPLAGFGVAWYFEKNQRRSLAAGAFAGVAILFTTTLLGFASIRANQHKISAPLIEMMRSAASRKAADRDRYELGAFDLFEPSLVFYARKPVPDFGTVNAAGDFMRGSEHAYLVTYSDRMDVLQPHLPVGVQVIARKPTFLKKGREAVLIGWPAGAWAPAADPGRRKIGNSVTEKHVATRSRR